MAAPDKTNRVNEGKSARIAIIAVTQGGGEIARTIAAHLLTFGVEPPVCYVKATHWDGRHDEIEAVPYEGSLRDHTADWFRRYNVIVFVLALGAVVRIIAPCLVSKYDDPAVLSVDEAGQFVIPVVSGHVGGANLWAERLASALGATAVVTTASDVTKTLPVDILGREYRWQRLTRDSKTLTRVAAAVVNRQPVAMIQQDGETDWRSDYQPWPASIIIIDAESDPDPGHFQALLWIGCTPPPEALSQLWSGRMVAYLIPEDIMESSNA
ncbi:MAG: cobalamin biosynthesis protein CbiG [Magnetococcales bacterium]|nr:cobalamin biosynthesis protein CbiG [Magnetococcales bacterium]